MRNSNLSSNYKFREYYLVNKAWIKKYKDYYNFTKISDELDKNSLVQNSFDNIILDNQNTNFNLKDKLVALIIKQLPKNIIDDFNNRDSNFDTFYKNEVIHDFEIINAEIYDSLFKYMNMNILIHEGKSIVFNNDALITKAEKVECIFEDELIIIQFPNPNTEGKYLIEIGKLNNNNLFEPEYFLLYERYNYINEHVQNIIQSGGFKEYCKTFSELPLNTMEIIDNNNIKLGIAIKRNMNNNYKNFYYSHSLDKLNKDNKYTDIEDIKKSQIQKKKLFSFDEKLNNNSNKKFEENPNLIKSKLEDENNKLKDELNNYKRENEKLKKEINKLKEDNMKLNSELINTKNIIINLNHIQENNQDNIKIINNLKELIQVKNKEINDLEMKLIDKGKNNRLVNYDDIFFVHFISKDEKINCGIKCLKTDTFAEVEKKFYEKYPEYRETNNQFLLRGKSILRDKKICENFIKDCDMILIINT